MKYDRDSFRQMEAEDQVDIMRRWFFAYYEDPAQETPHSGQDGGYQYIHGGPYDAEEELRGEFEDIAQEGSIENLTSELAELGWEWAPTTKHPDYTV